MACPDNEEYDIEYKRCEECKQQQTFNPETLRCECPSSEPFWTGSVCVSCEGENSYYNIQHHKC